MSSLSTSSGVTIRPHNTSAHTVCLPVYRGHGRQVFSRNSVTISSKESSRDIIATIDDLQQQFCYVSFTQSYAYFLSHDIYRLTQQKSQYKSPNVSSAHFHFRYHRASFIVSKKLVDIITLFIKKIVTIFTL